jgi:nucleoid-associated protein YgaU
MRKLVLFAVLGGVFGLALLLEHFVTRPGPRRTDDADHLVAVFGGLPPREIPSTPPDDADAPAANRGGAAERPKGAGKPASGGDHPAEIPAALAKEHVVARGETLASIARAQLGSANRWRDLALWNGIADPMTVPAGAHLRLTPPDAQSRPEKGQAEKAQAPPAKEGAPAPTKEAAPAPTKEAAKDKAPAAGDRTYRVAKGDTLSHIAAQYLGDASRWREIQRLNNIPDPANLNEGRMLQLPQR